MTAARITTRLPSCLTVAPRISSSLPIVTTSTTRGTFVTQHSSPPRMLDARIGKAEFFAPPILTFPCNGLPPVMTILSILLPNPLSVERSTHDQSLHHQG